MFVDFTCRDEYVYLRYGFKMEQCSVGIATKTDCHLKDFCKETKLYCINTLASTDISLLKYRLKGQFPQSENPSICLHHKCIHLKYFSKNFRKCCAPLQQHIKPVTEHLQVIDLDLVADCIKYISINLIPGDKLCKFCLAKIKKTISTEKGKLQTEVRNLNLNKM